MALILPHIGIGASTLLYSDFSVHLKGISELVIIQYMEHGASFFQKERRPWKLNKKEIKTNYGDVGDCLILSLGIFSM